jgi:hypothetical protein
MRTHTGGCHCGRVRFEVVAPARITVSECNCSICSKSGYLHLIVPAERFKLLSGSDSHPDGISVNARCIDGGSIESMSIKPFNGRNWDKGRAEYDEPDL